MPFTGRIIVICGTFERGRVFETEAAGAFD